MIEVFTAVVEWAMAGLGFLIFLLAVYFVITVGLGGHK